MQRQADLDWLRGLMLVLMTVTHVPTWFSAHLGQPFGFTSAAEGFVFLSAYLVGSVYGGMERKAGFAAMRRALWLRTLRVYAVHVALLLSLLWLLVPLALARGGSGVAITNLASFYLRDPQAALVGGLLLTYDPPLLDILPMYVVFLAASPLLIGYAQRRGWTVPLCVGVVAWLAAQHGGGHMVYDAIASTFDLQVPYSQTGAFSWLAWQLLWLVGLWAGTRNSAERAAGTPANGAWPRGLVPAALLAAGVFFVWRHATGQIPSASDVELNAMFDKWHLGPLRLLNFAVLAILVVRLRPVLARWAQNSPIAVLGQAPLTVFSAHLVVCLALLATIGESVPAQINLRDCALLAGTLAALYFVAVASLGGGRAIRSRRIAILAHIRTRALR